MSEIRKLVDNDGENIALRSFLRHYGGMRAPTIGEMRDNMELSGWVGCWPDFVIDAVDRTPLTEACAQQWIRHILQLERGTPAAQWREKGQPDPHARQYNGERAALAYGSLSDDALANAVYLCDHRTSFSSIGFLTAAKERIRWLSRALAAACSRAPMLDHALAMSKIALEAARASHGVQLMSMPPRDAWQERGVDGKIHEALAAIEAVPA